LGARKIKKREKNGEGKTETRKNRFSKNPPSLKSGVVMRCEEVAGKNSLCVANMSTD